MPELLECGHEESPHSDFTRGYSTDAGTGERRCYSCSAEAEREFMRKEGRTTLYLDLKEGRYFVADWPGTLRIPVERFRVHMNAGGFGSQRIDVWFTLEGARWHGVNRGDNDLLRCRRLKAKRNG